MGSAQTFDCGIGCRNNRTVKGDVDCSTPCDQRALAPGHLVCPRGAYYKCGDPLEESMVSFGCVEDSFARVRATRGCVVGRLLTRLGCREMEIGAIVGALFVFKLKTAIAGRAVLHYSRKRMDRFRREPCVAEFCHLRRKLSAGELVGCHLERLRFG